MKKLTPEEMAYFEILNDPVKWAKAELNWTARDYQIPILRALSKKRKVVLRLGRRLGKTEVLCIIVLWYAYTQQNKGENEQYDIRIITPYEAQVDLIFKRLQELIKTSTTIKGSIDKDIHHKLVLNNGSNIYGMTAGSKSNSGAESTRGQRADVIILDEVDYMGDDDITNLMNIQNEDPERIALFASSTPSGRRAKYYYWCTNASYSFSPGRLSVQDIEAGAKIEYKLSRKVKGGNGWTHFHAPSIVNKNLLKYNEDTGRTYLEDLKEELTELRYEQEVMAEFGEEAVGVFQKKYIDAAVELGDKLGVVYYDNDYPRRGPRILGVDWDKYQAEATIIAAEYNQMTGLFVPILRVAIPRTEFTLTNAVNKIIDLNKEFDFDWIYVDRGYGEMQVEQLKLYGRQHPSSGMAHKVIGHTFSDKIIVRDPVTKEKVKKELKQFMVNNAVKAFEEGKIALNPRDKELIKQFEDYHVVSIGNNGMPKFSDEDEHMIDALGLCLLGFAVKYSDMLKVGRSHKISGLNNTLGARSDKDAVKGREEWQDTAPKKAVPLGGVFIGQRKNAGRAKIGMPKRATF